MIDGGTVSGILDFEFSGMGYQAMDFAIGLAAFSFTPWGHGCSWPRVEAFAAGYLHVVALQRAHLTAVPTLLLMREVTSLIHWLGRMEQGLTTFDDVQERACRLISLHRWLDTHGSELVDLLLSLPKPGKDQQFSC